MRKIISILLLCSLVLVCASACTVPGNDGEETTAGNIEETTAGNGEETTAGNVEETTAENDEETTVKDDDTDETTQGSGEGELVEDSDLIYELGNFLQQEFHGSIDPAIRTVAMRINEIKRGTQPLLVAFDSSSCYFVCAYYQSDTHEEYVYCCSEKYTTWVRYENASDIQEYYNGVKIAVAFQINKTSYAADILSDEANVPNFEHFRIYEPLFNDGLNTRAADVFDEMFIYLNKSDKSNVYYCIDVDYNEFNTFECVDVDGKLYIPIHLHTTYANGNSSDEDIYEELGEYYDVIMSFLEENDPYIVVENGITRTHGLISVDDLADNVIK